MRLTSTDTSRETEMVMIDLLSKAPVWRRLQLADQMSLTARRLALSGVRQRYPDADEEEIRRRFADLHLGEDLANKVFGAMPM
jgi:hypothetical protein